MDRWMDVLEKITLDTYIFGKEFYDKLLPLPRKMHCSIPSLHMRTTLYVLLWINDEDQRLDNYFN